MLGQSSVRNLGERPASWDNLADGIADAARLDRDLQLLILAARLKLLVASWA
jgi:hypothetical protein